MEPADRPADKVRAGIRFLPQMLPWPTRTPFTFWYLVLLALVMLLLRLDTKHEVHRLLAESSTNAVNLQHHPVKVLFMSALWLQDGHWLIYAVIFAMVIAPLERQIGARWTILVFASGHVLATLASELPVVWAIHAHLLPHGDAHLHDVGVSYGLFATAGVLVMLLPAISRWWAVAGLNIMALGIFLWMGTSTDSIVTVFGHLCSIYIGVFGWLSWLRRRDLLGSLRPTGWARWADREPCTVLAPERTDPTGSAGESM